MATTSHEVTKLLADWSNGDQLALDQLMRLVEGELRQMAHRYMARQNPGHTLQTTALINEAFVKLIGQPDKHFQNREHFFGVAASAMRHILVDYARSKQYGKRGGGAPVVSLDEALTVTEERATELVALDDALKELANFDARKAQVVELRFFGGLSIEETAKALNVAEITVIRDWNFSKSWLHRELSNTQTE